MSQDLRQYNAAPELYLSALTSAWHREKVRHPSLWLARDPDAEEQMLRDVTTAP